MRKQHLKIYITFAIFYVVGCLQFLPSVAQGQDFITSMKKCMDVLEKNTKISYVLKIEAFGKETETSSWKKDGETEAVYYRNKEKFYYKMQTLEWIVDSKGALSISHPQMLVMYQKNKKKSSKPITALQRMDSLINKYKTWKSVEFKALDSKYHQYTITAPQANIALLVLVMDMSLSYIVRVEYIYAKSLVGENLKTVISFTNFSLNPQYPKDIFDYSRYISFVNGKIVLQAPYKGYELVSNE